MNRTRTKTAANTAAKVVALASCVLFFGCQANEQIIEDDFNFDGSCVNCHTGLSAGQVHPTFKLRCIDCHGGNDQVDVPNNAADDANVYRDEALIALAHVRPKAGLARFFYANGQDDDLDGLVDEAPTIVDDGFGNETVVDFGEIAEFGLQGEGIGEFIDAELNRDLNYTRWLNPGDLRVATASCGSGSRLALDGEGGGACHQSLIATVRRSIMVNQGAVLNGAYYGNESWRPQFQADRDDQGAAADPRAGAYGYTLNYDGIDECIDTSATGDPEGRGQPVFDSPCLEAKALQNDPNAGANGPGNFGLPAFEATQGKIVGSAPGTEPGKSIEHRGVANSRFRWGGQDLLDPAAALPEMQPPPDQELVAGVPDPIDLVLRGFRAYYPLNYPGSGNNFNFTFGESIRPGIDDFKTNNPFGRGHASGCTSCHTLYNYDGSRNPQKVTSFDDDGNATTADVLDPTTKHREFDPDTQDIVNVGGKNHLIGMTVNVDERAESNDFNDPDARDQQRHYSANHELTSKITTQQCGLCHAFVTRINFAYQGIAEDEQRDKLSRERAIEFTTPDGTNVTIHDSWVREQLQPGGDPANRDDFDLVIPTGQAVIDRARERDRQLTEGGLLPGAGGCAPELFSEDCNNNGILDTNLLLQKFDESGSVVTEVTINEDLDNNGRLDLISHVPRRNSVDGRQQRYVYGGGNGATRLMDIHFERGMHCIDCHMLQDAHGDGNIYSTNWEAIEIECEDCHGTRERATLFTSGANGGNDLRGAVGHDGRPFFEDQGRRMIQRSRVTDGLFWEIPQVSDSIDPESERFNPLAQAAHDPQHMPDPVAPGAKNTGSLFAGAPGQSELQEVKLECYTCHTSWVHNCMGCHYNVNLGDDVKKFVNPDGTIDKVAGENEVWFNNKNQAARTNFQLLSFLRSPIVFGTNAAADGHRLAPFRSSMQVGVSINDADGHTLFDNVTFSTFQAVDGNSGRANVATSGSAMNQTMPHTVRPRENQSCETCHALVDSAGNIRNNHVLAQSFGVGAGRYPYIGDWAMQAGSGATSGLEFFEYKQEEQLAGNTVGASTRFPGIIVNPNTATPANVEPVFDGSSGIDGTFVGTDVVLVRNFQPSPSGGSLAVPTLADLAIVSVENGTLGRLIITDVTFRGHPVLAAAPSVGDTTLVAIVNLPNVAMAVAHLTPDVSDPFVYVANGTSGLSVVELNTAPGLGQVATLVGTTAIPGGLFANELTLAGDVAYVGTTNSTIEVFDLSNPRAPTHVRSVPVSGSVNGLAVGGFVLFAGTDAGLNTLSLADGPTSPVSLGSVAGFVANEIFFSEGHVYVAAGGGGVLDINATVPAQPANLGNIVQVIAPGETVDAVDVVVSKVPGQTWLLVSETSGDLVGLKLDNRQSTRERCMPDPIAAGCGTDMDWRDPTIMGRDPAFLPAQNAFDPADPSGAPFFRMTSTLLTSGGRLARPAYWEQIGTLSGRRVRDSFMPGSGVLSFGVMQRMSAVPICEAVGTADRNGNGLGELGGADGDFFATGTCRPYSETGSLLMSPLPAADVAPTCDVPDDDEAAGEQCVASGSWPDVAAQRHN